MLRGREAAAAAAAAAGPSPPGHSLSLPRPLRQPDGLQRALTEQLLPRGRAAQDDSPTAPEPKVEPFVPVTKKHEAQILPVEVKPQETGAGKKRHAVKKQKIENDIQNTLLAKDSEVKSLHSKLTDTMVSKQQLEQKLMQLMEAEKNRVTENAIQIQVQITSIVLRTNKMLFSIGRATRTLITASLSGTGNETEKESEIVTEKESAKETMIEKETVTERFTETMFLVMQSVIEWTESAFERTEDRYHLDLLLIERQKKFHPQDVMAFRGLHMIVNLNALAWINPHLEDSPLCVIGRVTKFNEMLNKCFLPPERYCFVQIRLRLKFHHTVH